MDLWFTEDSTKDVRFSFRVNQHLYSKQSPFQKIDIFQTNEFGKVLVLDDCLMVTEKDEFIYHEMIVHVPMAVNPNIKRVLLIGAGDGGAVRELTRYPHIERIDMVEIDEEVVKACIEYIPSIACKLREERVHIYYEDGMKFVRSKQNDYDLIIVDSTDPFGPGEGLFTKEFYGNCYNALKEHGIMVNQMESIFYEQYALMTKRAFQRIKSLFPVCRVYQAHIPTYPSGHWLFGFASKGFDPVSDQKRMDWEALNLHTNYYNSEIHSGCFAVPNYVKEYLKEDL